MVHSIHLCYPRWLATALMNQYLRDNLFIGFCPSRFANLFFISLCAGWADLLEEFLRFGSDSDHHYDKLLVIYLLIAVSAGGFVFANLIVAVIVTNLEVAVKEFREEKAMSENPLEFYVITNFIT